MSDPREWAREYLTAELNMLKRWSVGRDATQEEINEYVRPEKIEDFIGAMKATEENAHGQG